MYVNADPLAEPEPEPEPLPEPEPGFGKVLGKIIKVGGKVLKNLG